MNRPTTPIMRRATEAMVEHRERIKYPPVPGMAHMPEPVANPFGDMQDRLAVIGQVMRNANEAPVPVIEPMVDARQAAAALRLPYYWFADHAMRKRYRIPHYLLGGLVRYRLSELLEWAAQSASTRQRDAADGHQPSEGTE